MKRKQTVVKTRVSRSARGIVLAQGEATGHAHTIASRDATLYALDTASKSVRLLAVRRPVGLSHEEHKTRILPRGKAVVVPKRQYTPEGWEDVRD